MYTVSITTPKGLVQTHINNIEELQEVLNKYPDYTGVVVSNEDRPKVLKRTPNK